MKSVTFARATPALVLAPALMAIPLGGATRAASTTSAYYVARDNNATAGGSANPNQGRLTFLFSHGDHFHSLGRVGGPEGRVPEAFVGGAIRLFGRPDGRHGTAPYHDPADPTAEYSHLEIRDIHDLAPFASGTPEATLYNSSGRRWSTLGLDGGLIAFELVEISTGLNLATADGAQVASAAGDRVVLGSGSGFRTPFQFFTDPGPVTFGQRFSAVLRLVDLRTSGPPFASSGNIRFEFQAVPEPGGFILAGAGVIGVAVLAHRRRRVQTGTPA